MVNTTTKLQFIAAVLIAAHLVAYGISEVIGVAYLKAIPTFLSVVGVLGWILWRWSVAERANPARTLMEQAMAEIKSLSMEEAMKKAHGLLEDTAKFKCVKAKTDLQTQYQIAGSLREFFSAYESVEAIAGEARVSRRQIGLSEYLIGFLRIGENIEFTEVVVRPDEDSVYEVDGSETSEPDLKASQVPSIYHWILVTSEVLYSSSNADTNGTN